MHGICQSIPLCTVYVSPLRLARYMSVSLMLLRDSDRRSLFVNTVMKCSFYKIQKAVPWFRLLVAGLSLQSAGFNPGQSLWGL
jgi:hypothetical protein